LCREIDKVGVDRDDVDAGLQQPEIEVVDRAFVTARDEHHPGFQQTGRRQKPGFRLGDRFVETVRLRLSEKDGDEGRRIDHHQFGNPFSS
jgi:hypothetical protein